MVPRGRRPARWAGATPNDRGQVPSKRTIRPAEVASSPVVPNPAGAATPVVAWASWVEGATPTRCPTSVTFLCSSRARTVRPLIASGVADSVTLGTHPGILDQPPRRFYGRPASLLRTSCPSSTLLRHACSAHPNADEPGGPLRLGRSGVGRLSPTRRSAALARLRTCFPADHASAGNRPHRGVQRRTVRFRTMVRGESRHSVKPRTTACDTPDPPIMMLGP